MIEKHFKACICIHLTSYYCRKVRGWAQYWHEILGEGREKSVFDSVSQDQISYSYSCQIQWLQVYANENKPNVLQSNTSTETMTTQMNGRASL